MLESFTDECVGIGVDLLTPIRLRSFISADCYQNFVSLSIRVDLFLSQPIHQLTCDVKLSLYVHFFINQIYSHAENTPQISYYSSQTQGPFPLLLITLNNIPMLSVHRRLLSLTSIEIHNTLWPLAIQGHTLGLLNNQPVLSEKSTKSDFSH